MIIINKELGSEFSCMSSCIDEYNAGNEDLLDYMRYIISELEKCKNKKMISYYKCLFSFYFLSLFKRNDSVKPLLELSEEGLTLYHEWLKLLAIYIKKTKATEDYTCLNTVNVLLMGNDSLEKVSEYLRYISSINEDLEIHIGDTYLSEQMEYQKRMSDGIKIMKSLTLKDANVKNVAVKIQ